MSMIKEAQELVEHEYYMRVGLAMFKLDKAYETFVEGSVERDKAYEDYRQQRNDAYTDYRQARKAKWNLEYVIGQKATDLSATELMVAIRNEKRKAYEAYLEFRSDILSLECLDHNGEFNDNVLHPVVDTWNLEGAFASYIHDKYRRFHS